VPPERIGWRVEVPDRMLAVDDCTGIVIVSSGVPGMLFASDITEKSTIVGDPFVSKGT